VRLARDVLKAASGWRRSDVLSGARTVVDRNQKLGNEAIAAALSARGIDWRQGPPGLASEELPVRLTVEVVGGGALEAGTREKVAVTAENTGSRPLYRVAAVATDGGLLSRREFLFGLLAPGDKRTYVHEFEVPAGWPSEQVKVEFAVRDSGKEPLGKVPVEITYAGRPLPSFAWSWVATDTAHGNGDGVLQPGERVEVALTVRNVGQGASTDAFARLRNHAGAQIDLLVGTLGPGVVETEPQGGPSCGGAKQEPCPRRLGPGESWSGSFELRVDPAESGSAAPLELALDLGDGTAYDQAAAWRVAWVDRLQQEERITLVPGAPLPAGDLHEPPVIEVTRHPGLRVDGSRAVISGAVRDDRGLQHVMVYVGEDKVFLETGTAGAQHLRSLPFTADAALEAGSNVVTVVATDDQGSQSTRSIVIWHDGEAVAQAR
jgi:carboxyl-terminal processing protease